MLSSLAKLVESLSRLKDFSLNESDWHEPELSIGIQCNSFGAYQCWEADGPAKQLFREISADIAALLYARAEEIDYGEPLAGHVLMFGLYMIGKDRSKARPTLLFSHPRPKPRQRAKNFVKESDILQRYPKIVLAESREVPMAQGLVRFRAKSPSQSFPAATSIKAHLNAEFRISESKVYEVRAKQYPANPTTCIQIISPLGKVAVIGLVLRYHGKLYGVTVAHAFMERQGPNHNIDGTLHHHGTATADDTDIDKLHRKSGDNVEFAFDDDVDDGSDEDEEENIAMTSTGSISSDSSESGLSSASARLESAQLNLLSRNDERRNWDSLRRQYLGEILPLSSISEDSVGLDWVLVNFLFKPPRALKIVDLEWLEAVVSSKIPDTPRKVHAVNGHGVSMRGSISSNPTMMRLPFCKDFQELWTVRFDGICEDGDCGSWVEDDDNGIMYGQIVAGHPGSGVAYIIPAAKILRSIRTELTKIEDSVFNNQRSPLRGLIKSRGMEIFSAIMRGSYKLFQLCGHCLIIILLAIPLWDLLSPVSIATLFQALRKGTHQETPHSLNENIVPSESDMIVTYVFCFALCISTVIQEGSPTSDQDIVRDMSLIRQLWSVAKRFSVGMIAPELVLAASYRDYCSVRKSQNEIWMIGSHGMLVASGDTGLEFELPMGGVDLPKGISGEVSYRLEYSERLSDAAASNSSKLDEVGVKKSIPILLPPWIMIEERDSVHRLLPTLMITFQLSSFSIPVLIRYFNALSLTPQEMVAIAYTVCAVTTYYIWLQQQSEIKRHLSKPIKARQIERGTSHRLSEQTLNREFSSLKNIGTMVFSSNSWRWGVSFGGFIFGTLHLAAWDINFPTMREKQLWRISSLALMSPLVVLVLCQTLNKLGFRNFVHLKFGKEATAFLTNLLLFFAIYLYIFARVFLFVEPFWISRTFPKGVDLSPAS